MARIINWNGTPDYPLRPANGRQFTRMEIETLLQGSLMLSFSLRGDEVMTVTSDGPYNSRATEIAELYSSQFIKVYGFALICKKEELPLDTP